MPVYSSLQFVKLRDTTTAILATPTANEHAGENKNVQASTPQTICRSKNKKKRDYTVQQRTTPTVSISGEAKHSFFLRNGVLRLLLATVVVGCALGYSLHKQTPPNVS